MKTIKIQFVDFWRDFNPKDFWLYKLLCKHYDVQISNTPDYLVYSCFGVNKENFGDNIRYRNCVKIAFLDENLAPDFNECDYAISHELITFGDRHIYYPDFFNSILQWNMLDIDRKHIAKRDNFCSYVYSNPNAVPFREELYQAINAYKRVDGGGRLHHTVDIEHIDGQDWKADRIQFEKNYKFSIACENSSHPGYSTEKILISYAAGTIPIYWGDPQIKTIFNEKSFICVNDFSSLDDLVERIREIDQDDMLYREMLTEPIFADNFDIAERNREIECFLLNIFDQPLEKAFRRNNDFWGDYYQSWFERNERNIDRVAAIMERKDKEIAHYQKKYNKTLESYFKRIIKRIINYK